MASTQPLSNHDSSNDSQATTVMTESDRVFTPPGSDSEASTGHDGRGNNHSSQDSQLMQLSQLAAARERMVEVDSSTMAGVGGPSKKRMADGEVKHARGGSNVSPVRMGHSRNTSAVSAVSVASTTGSRIGQVG